MPKSARLSECLDEIDLEFVEREAKPRLLVKLSIQCHLPDLSVSYTVCIIDKLGVEWAQSTVRNCVNKADPQPEDGRAPNHVAVGETVIQLDDEWYRLYAALDSEVNGLPHTKLEPTRTRSLTYDFLADLREKHDGDDAVFLVDGTTPLKDAYRRHGLEFRYKRHGIRSNITNIGRNENW